jgi:hypothetical protein
MGKYAGILEYKCRRCSKLTRENRSPDCMASMIAIFTNNPSPFMGVSPNMQEIHFCADGHMGVADLIGVSLDKVSKVAPREESRSYAQRE